MQFCCCLSQSARGAFPGFVEVVDRLAAEVGYFLFHFCSFFGKLQARCSCSSAFRLSVWRFAGGLVVVVHCGSPFHCNSGGGAGGSGRLRSKLSFLARGPPVPRRRPYESSSVTKV